MVKDVEELGAKLEASPLGQHSGLEEGEIPISVAGTGKSIAAEVSDGTVCGRSEGGGREELRNSSSGTAVGIKPAMEFKVEVGTNWVASVTGAGGVIGKLRAERESGLERRDGAEDPSITPGRSKRILWWPIRRGLGRLKATTTPSRLIFAATWHMACNFGPTTPSLKILTTAWPGIRAYLPTHRHLSPIRRTFAELRSRSR